MGLDMYLMAKVKVKNWRPYDEGAGQQAHDKLGQKISGISTPPEGAKFEKNTSEIEVGCWRKANHIHNWFVENVQEGTDDCEGYAVTLENLAELEEACNHALLGDTGALPPKSGFFFGSTEIDEGYFEHCRETILICKRAREVVKKAQAVADRRNKAAKKKGINIGSTYVEMYYCSSW